MRSHIWNGGGRAPLGVFVLGFDNDKDADTRRKYDRAATAGTSVGQQKKRKKGAGGTDIGNALRSAYQRTIDEQIPPDLLDLLGKLG